MSAEDTASEIIEAAEASTDIRDTLLRLADAGEKLLESGLTRRALVILLQDQTGLNRGAVGAVLDALPALREYVK